MQALLKPSYLQRETKYFGIDPSGVLDTNLAFAVTVLTPGTANQLLVTNSAGTAAAWASDVTIPGTLTLTNDAILAATYKLRLDGSASGDTYLTEFSADRVDLNVGGARRLLVSTSQFIASTVDFIIDGAKKFYLDGGGDTYMYENAPNVLDIVVNGNLMLRSNGTQMGFFGNAVVSRQAYTITNPSTSRSLDVGAATLAELRAVVGTFIADIKNLGFAN